MHSPHATARRLVQLDHAMRVAKRPHTALAALCRFYEAAVSAYALHRLERLGALVPDALLSARSLDLVFEDDRYNDAVIASILSKADQDATFKTALVEQVGESCLAYWRDLMTRDLFDQTVAA